MGEDGEARRVAGLCFMSLRGLPQPNFCGSQSAVA